MIHQGFLKIRILVIFFVGIFFFLFIIGRALQLQLIPNRKLSELAKRQYRTAITLFPKRGTIYDRNMNELAVSRKVGSLFANPNKIKAPKYVARRLSALTGISDYKIYQKIKSKKSFVWIERLLSDSVTQRIKEHPMEGIGILDEYKRFYPNQELAGQLLGVVGIDSQGIEGLEYSHDDVLFGKKSSIKMIRDALGRPITFDETLFVEPQEGVSLILSIEQSLQFMIEKELELAVIKFQARRGAAIVQDVRTGEILAMANYPFFNPNRFFSGERSHWKNAALTDAFEPGSTFKVILSALALEKGISPSEKFFCENGFYRVNREAAIREAENHKYGWLTFSDILKFSSNIGAAKIASQLGKIAFSRKILEFGFGRKTGIDAPGESPGIVRPYKEWGLIDLTNIAFGQGISVTAIQLVSAISAIANGGRLMRPFIVKKRIDPKMGEVIETETQFVAEVMSPEAARRLTRMLVRVTEQGGTGFSAAMQEYKVAGKTGTAQKPDLQGRGYFSDKYISSFLGFFPETQPQYAIFVMIDEPKKIYYAAEVAAPLFKQIAILTAQLFPPLSRLVSQKRSQKKAQKKKETDFHDISERESAIKWDKMPNLRGKSMYDVLKFGREAGINIVVKGSGIAVDQCRDEGSLIEVGQSCMVTFKAQTP